jgi:hypothetical protein
MLIACYYLVTPTPLWVVEFRTLPIAEGAPMGAENAPAPAPCVAEFSPPPICPAGTPGGAEKVLPTAPCVEEFSPLPICPEDEADEPVVAPEVEPAAAPVADCDCGPTPAWPEEFEFEPEALAPAPTPVLAPPWRLAPARSAVCPASGSASAAATAAIIRLIRFMQSLLYG